MGELISFRASRKVARAAGAAPPAGGAAILFFMGVRYNRDIEPAPEPVKRKTPPKGGVAGRRGKRRG